MTTAVNALFCLFSRNFFRYLYEAFVLPDHAQFKAGTFFNRVVALFQVTDFSICLLYTSRCV